MAADAIRNDKEEEIHVITTSTFLGSFDSPTPTTINVVPSRFSQPNTSTSSSTTAPQSTTIPMSPAPTTTTPTIHVQPLLILDLNGILCHRSRLRREPPGVRLRPAVGPIIANTPIIPRPNWIAWLTWLDRYFCVAIWTSAKATTAHQLLKALVPATLRKRFLFVWSQHDCIPRRQGREEPPLSTSQPSTIESNNNNNNHDYDYIIYEKHLSKVWQLFPLWNSGNTLLMDDSPDKSPLSQARNVLHPPPIHGQQSEPPVSLSSSSVSTSLSSSWQSDEENVQKQEHFFRLLIQYWSDHSDIYTLNKRRVDGFHHKHQGRRRRGQQQAEQQEHQPTEGGDSSCCNNDGNQAVSFYNFLNAHATGHMGWRGNQSTS